MLAGFVETLYGFLAPAVIILTVTVPVAGGMYLFVKRIRFNSIKGAGDFAKENNIKLVMFKGTNQNDKTIHYGGSN